MNHFHKLLFFIKVLLGMCVSLVIFAVIDIRWWQDEGVIIPIMLLADAIISFYFVYRLVKIFNFPLGVFSIIPVVYGVLVPLIAILMSVTIDTPIVSVTLNKFFHNNGGITFIEEAVIILFSSSIIALMLTCVFTWVFLKTTKGFRVW